MSRPLPDFVPPMLAMPGTPFDSDRHLFEIKWDGTRAVAFIDDKGVRLMNRRGRDITERYPEFACLDSMPPGTVLDGEVVVIQAGKPDFQALQRREQARSAFRVRNVAHSLPATYMVFDQMYDRYAPVLDQPCAQRREKARANVSTLGSPRVLMSEGMQGDGIAYFQQAEHRGLEGVVAKRMDSGYVPGKRTDAWIKIKRFETVPCAIIGYLKDDQGGLKSLALASESNGVLRYVGKVGSGLDEPMRDRLLKLLADRPRAAPVVDVDFKGKWVEPGLYCTVRFMERTRDGHLRAPTFVELL